MNATPLEEFLYLTIPHPSKEDLLDLVSEEELPAPFNFMFTGLDYEVKPIHNYFQVTLENPFLQFNLYPQQWWGPDRLNLELSRAVQWKNLISAGLTTHTLSYYSPSLYSIRAQFEGCKPFTILNSQQRLLVHGSAHVLDSAPHIFLSNLDRITS